MTGSSGISVPGKGAGERARSRFSRVSGKPTLQDRADIQDVICAMVVHIDNYDYDAAQAVFTEDAILNYASTYGPEWEAISQHEFWKTMRQYHRGYDSGVHPITNFMIGVDGDRASCESFVGAIMRIDDRYWPNGGVYRHELRRANAEWKISYMEYELRYSLGDDRDWIVEEALRRVQPSA